MARTRAIFRGPSADISSRSSRSLRLRLQADDQRFVWHPFTQMREWAQEPPLLIVRGEGRYLVDIQGRRYFDGVSSIWVNIHGHRQPALDRAINDQLRRIAHSTLLGVSNIPSIELARRLVEIAPPGLTKVFYSDNGSTAVEVAVKLAFQFWQQQGPKYRKKTKFIAFHRAYHGDTLGAISLGGIPLFHDLYRPLQFPTFKVHPPYCYRCPLTLKFPRCRLACLEPVEATLKAKHRVIAAVVVEPMIQAAGGMITSPPGYLHALRELCTTYDVLLIADEVATGFGRTGRMFACEHEGVTPDLMAVSKGLTGGYMPLAATLATQRIFDGFLGAYDEFRAFFHGHSYTGNPLGCAVAVANLRLFKERRVLEKLPQKVDALCDALHPLKKLKHVGEVRQIGLMAGIELVRRKKTKEPYPIAQRIGHAVALEARSNGLMLRPLGNVIVLMPPLASTIGELSSMVKIVQRAIRTVTQRS